MYRSLLESFSLLDQLKSYLLDVLDETAAPQMFALGGLVDTLVTVVESNAPGYHPTQYHLAHPAQTAWAQETPAIFVLGQNRVDRFRLRL